MRSVMLMRVHYVSKALWLDQISYMPFDCFYFLMQMLLVLF